MQATDSELLQRFTQSQSQDAFAALVQRHMSLVYSAALRQVRSAELAEEVAQAVFIALARQASDLRQDTLLAAWLYEVTRRKSVDVVRGESRRQARERRILEEGHLIATESTWSEISPLLDEAMDALEESDRTALVLRYFENLSLKEVGQALAISDDAAQKRVSRAVDTLRAGLVSRGLSIASASLIGLLSGSAVQSAPALLIGKVAILATTSTSTSSFASTTLTYTFAMKTLTKTLIALAFVGVVAVTTVTLTTSKQNASSPTMAFPTQPESRYTASERAQANRILSDATLLRTGFMIYASAHSNRAPTQLDQIAEFYGGAESPVLQQFARFEILPATAGDQGKLLPDRILFRERTPRLGNSGAIHRMYAFGDGRVMDVEQPVAGFDLWEKDQTSGKR